MKKKNYFKISVKLRECSIVELKRLAVKYNTTQSAVIRMLLERGLDEIINNEN